MEARFKPLTIVKDNVQKGRSTREKVENTFTEEIVIGICSPIGSMRENVIEEITLILKEDYKYEVQKIKLSDFIQKHSNVQGNPVPGETKSFTELMSKIKGGNELREKYNQSVLVELAIRQISLDRQKDSEQDKLLDPTDMESRRVCYIIDSLKNKEELHILRAIYKELFYLFSVFSPREERQNLLRSKGLSDPEIRSIIDTDDFENNNSGQNVRNTFVEADFFIRVSKKSDLTLNERIRRCLHLIFNSKIVTPSSDEIAMYEAKSAAGNSACLSRQVGASITSGIGEVLSRGWNDVPKFGGNLYSEGDPSDQRCLIWGKCSNDSTKDELTTNIIENILHDKKVKELINFHDDKSTQNIAKELERIIRKSTKIKDLIEFSRSVHAEMHAIIIGSQLSGSKMIGGKLYCTTYPCHNCARHIIVAGIKEIYYIEPYIKSLCVRLHEDAITEDEEDNEKVKILMFDGVAPRRFLEFFSMSQERKDLHGKLKSFNLTTIVPKTRLTLQALSTLESQAIHSLHETGFIEKEKE